MTGLYVEDCDISGAWDNSVDWVAVHYAHLVRSRVHAANWCAYAKGGSAYVIFDSNDFYDCGESGVAVGQGTGFEYMEAPWLRHEGYDVKVTNNVIRAVW